VRARDEAGRVLALPNQTPGLIERYGLSRAAVDQEVWTIDAGGGKLGGTAAVNRVLAELGGVWPWLSRALWLAPLFWLEDRVYRWVAAHRHRLARWGIAPECGEGIDCH